MITRWIKNWKNIITDTFSAVGFLLLFIEIIDYFFPDFTQPKNWFWGFIILSLIYGFYKNYPRSSFVKKIRDKDSWIEIKICDAFSNNGAVIVPINDNFDLSLDGNVQKAKSLQSKLINDFYDTKEEHLKNDIQKKLDLTKTPFPMGKTIEIEQKGKRIYLLVNSTKNENNRSSSTFDDFLMALNGLWDFLSYDASKDEAVTIPLINTQHGRNSEITRDIVIKQIIDTFIDTTKYKSICEKLIISIQQSDIKKGSLDFDILCDYLEFQCNNYKDIKYDKKVEGKEDVPSIVSSIKL